MVDASGGTLMSVLSSASVYERRRILVTAIFTALVVVVLFRVDHRHATGSASPTTLAATSDLAVATGSAQQGSRVTEAVTPGFLAGPRDSTAVSTPAIAGPALGAANVQDGMASFRNFSVQAAQPAGQPAGIPGPPTTALPLDTCAVPFLPEGLRVQVENTDNGRTVQCEVRNQPVPAGILVLLSTPLFEQLSPLTQTAIPVSISW
jgi:hypothetical protein